MDKSGKLDMEQLEWDVKFGMLNAKLSYGPQSSCFISNRPLLSAVATLKVEGYVIRADYIRIIYISYMYAHMLHIALHIRFLYVDIHYAYMLHTMYHILLAICNMYVSIYETYMAAICPHI